MSGDTWVVDGMSPEAVLSWAKGVAEGATRTSVILTRADEHGPVTMDGRATLLHHDVTDVGTFTVVLWGDRPDRRGGDYVVRQHVHADDGAGRRTEFGTPGDGRGPELFARYLAERRAAATSEAPRPRVRVLDLGQDNAPVLVIDRWTGDPDEAKRMDPRDVGFSGVLVFSRDVDLDDDGLDDEPPARVHARDLVLGHAREVAKLHDEGRDSAAAREHLARAVTEMDEA